MGTSSYHVHYIQLRQIVCDDAPRAQCKVNGPWYILEHQPILFLHTRAILHSESESVRTFLYQYAGPDK